MALDPTVKEALLDRADDLINDLSVSGLNTDALIAHLALIKARELVGGDSAEKLPASAVNRDLVTDGALAIAASGATITLGRVNPVSGVINSQSLTLPAATPSAAGLFSAADKITLAETVSRVGSLEQLGHYLGYVQTAADLPATQTALQTLWGKLATPNDFANVQTDEDHDDESSRYLITGIGPDGALTWAFELQLSYPERNFIADPIALDEIAPEALDDLDITQAFPQGALLTTDPAFSGLGSATRLFEKMDGHLVPRADYPVIANTFPTTRFFSADYLPESQSVSISGLTGAPLLQPVVGGDKIVATEQGFLYAPTIVAPTSAFQYPVFYSADFGVTWELATASLTASTLVAKENLFCICAQYMGGERAIFALQNVSRTTLVLLAVEGNQVKSIKRITSAIGTYGIHVIPTINIWDEGFAAGGVFIVAGSGSSNNRYWWYWQTGFNGVDTASVMSSSALGGTAGNTTYYNPKAEVVGGVARISASDIGNTSSNAGQYVQATVGTAQVTPTQLAGNHTGVYRPLSIAYSLAVTSWQFYASRDIDGDVFYFAKQVNPNSLQQASETNVSQLFASSTANKQSLGGLRGMAGNVQYTNNRYERRDVDNVLVEAGKAALPGYISMGAGVSSGLVAQDDYSLETFLVTFGNSIAIATLEDAAMRGATTNVTVVDRPEQFRFISGISYDALGFSLARGELIVPRISATLSEVEFHRHPFEPDSDTHAPMLYRNDTWIKMK